MNYTTKRRAKGRRRERAKGRRQQAASNKQQAGKPRGKGAKGRRHERAKGRWQQATGRQATREKGRRGEGTKGRREDGNKQQATGRQATREKGERGGVRHCEARSNPVPTVHGAKKDEGTKWRMCERKITHTRSLVYSFTDNTSLSSLRGTKQSSTMKHKRAYNDKGWKSIREGILDCFAPLAMTNEREGRKGEKKITLICSLVYSFTDNISLSSLRGTKQSRTMKHKRHITINVVSRFGRVFWIASLCSQ
jgi:hypothetical protein